MPFTSSRRITGSDPCSVDLDQADLRSTRGWSKFRSHPIGSHPVLGGLLDADQSPRAAQGKPSGGTRDGRSQGGR